MAALASVPRLHSLRNWLGSFYLLVSGIGASIVSLLTQGLCCQLCLSGIGRLVSAMLASCGMGSPTHVQLLVLLDTVQLPIVLQSEQGIKSLPAERYRRLLWAPSEGYSAGVHSCAAAAGRA